MPAEELPDLLKSTERKRSVAMRVLYVALAVLCFVAGVFGWLIPVMTGIPFYVAGFVFLALASERARAWGNRLERLLPESWRRALRRALAKVPSRRFQETINLPDAEPKSGA